MLLVFFFVSKVLHILPSRFEAFKSSYLLLNAQADKSLSNLSDSLIMHERNVTPVHSSTSSSSSEAMFAKSGQKSGSNVVAKTSGDQSVRNHQRNAQVCKYCSGKGHWLKKCSQWINDGKPPFPARANDTSGCSPQVNVSGCSPKLNDIDSEPKSALLADCEQLNLVTSSSDQSWWIDNGATKHITSNREWFHTYETFSKPNYVKAAGSRVTAVGHGSIEVASFVNGQLVKFDLTDVWYVPGISKNLFSVVAAHDKKPESRFYSNPTFCKFEADNRVMFTGTRSKNGSLFKASFETILPEPQVNAVESSEIVQLYHERWGHVDKNHVRAKLAELGLKKRSQETKTNSSNPCQFDKVHRETFEKRSSTRAVGELLSGDICGPFDCSFGGRKYLIVIKDNYSNYRNTFVEKEKTAAVVSCCVREVLFKAHALGHQVLEFQCSSK
ncbi:unnamed protein product, partial [Allacma fusca]